MEKVPDRQVQQALQLVFQKVRELGSARQTMLWCRDEQLRLPEAVPGSNGQEILWRLPSLSRIHQLLRNPVYAGACAYGRTGTKRQLTAGRQSKATRGRKSLADWSVLLLDHHEGYLTWAE